MTEENHAIRLLTEMRKEVRDGFDQAKAEREQLRGQVGELKGAIQEAKGLIMQIEAE